MGWVGLAFAVQMTVCREKGVSGMYQGMRAKLLHTVLTSALLFLGYERLVQVSHAWGGGAHTETGLICMGNDKIRYT